MGLELDGLADEVAELAVVVWMSLIGFGGVVDWVLFIHELLFIAEA